MGTRGLGVGVKPPGFVVIAAKQAEMLMLLQGSFEKRGFKVLLASCGEQAIATLDAKREWVCALLTDINLWPEPSGWEVARHARELKPDLPVVYMTGGGWP